MRSSRFEAAGCNALRGGLVTKASDLTGIVFTLPGLGIPGTDAQWAVIPARFLVKDTTGLPPEQVATLPMALATSVRAVKVIGGVKEHDYVLIQAGSSGSGSMQIQVAKALGANVETTIRKEEKPGSWRVGHRACSAGEYQGAPGLRAAARGGGPGTQASGRESGRGQCRPVARVVIRTEPGSRGARSRLPRLGTHTS